MKIINKIIKILYFLSLTAIISGCSLPSCNFSRRWIIKSQMKDYAGDGTIEFLPTGFLGAPGVGITFEPFSLTQRFSRSYKLINLPVTKQKYWVNLNVKEPLPREYKSEKIKKNTKAILQMKLSNNNSVIFNINKPLSSTGWIWTRGYSIGYLKFGKQWSEQTTTSFEVEDNKNSYTLYVEYDPKGTPIGTSGYFRISSGGYK